jgi:hypothetical protein
VLIDGVRFRRTSIWMISVFLFAAATLVGCGTAKMVENQIGSQPSLLIPTQTTQLDSATTSATLTATATMTQTVVPSVTPSVTPTLTPTAKPTAKPTATLFVPEALVDPSVGLHDKPVDVSIELEIPTLKIDATVVGVGLNSNNVMDTPTSSSAKDPIWQEVFWYRGGGIPGDVGTATIAGHVDDYLGRHAVFAHLKNIHKGDLIIIHDTRNGLEAHFTVTEVETYTAKESTEPMILEKIYGSGPVNGEGPQLSKDGLAHLTLITCSGWFINGSFDHHLVVYAVRIK